MYFRKQNLKMCMDVYEQLQKVLLKYKSILNLTSTK